MFACFTPRDQQGGKPAPREAVSLTARAMPAAPLRATPLAPTAATLAGPTGTHARAFARALVEKAEYR